MMVELDRGCPQDAPTCGTKPDAEIDVVEGNRKPLIKSSQLEEDIAPYCHASRRYAREILLETGPTEISSSSAGVAVEGMTGDSAQAENDAGVLNGVIRVV